MEQGTCSCVATTGIFPISIFIRAAERNEGRTFLFTQKRGQTTWKILASAQKATKHDKIISLLSSCIKSGLVSQNTNQGIVLSKPHSTKKSSSCGTARKAQQCSALAQTEWRGYGQELHWNHMDGITLSNSRRHIRNPRKSTVCRTAGG